jgi:hypothetical protein
MERVGKIEDDNLLVYNKFMKHSTPKKMKYFMVNGGNATHPDIDYYLKGLLYL